MKYAIGRITNDDDGNYIIIGADHLTHGMRDGKIRKLPENTEVEGYNSYGLTEFLIDRLKRVYPIDDMLDDYQITEDEFKEEIICVFEELGLG